MITISERVNRIQESKTIAMTKLGRELAATGIDVISLSIGEPDFDTPEYIIESAKKAMDEGYTHYTPVPGFPELRAAISNKFRRDNNLDYSPDQIVVSTGAKHSIMNVFLSILNPGDEVIVPTPYWVSYVDMVNHCDGKAVLIPTSTETNYLPDIGAIEKAITPRTKALIFSSPCNPSGAVFPESLLNDIADLFAKHPHILIISDEIYEHINYTDTHKSIGSIQRISKQVVTVNGLSKGFAMTGWRIGYIGAPIEVAKACEKLQGQYTSGTNSIAQMAAITALEGDTSSCETMKATFLKRRGLILDKLKEIPELKLATPDGAFYVFPDVSAYFGRTMGEQPIHNADDLAMYLLEEAHVAVVTGSAFGMPNCIRISYATSDANIVDAVARIKEALNKLT